MNGFESKRFDHGSKKIKKKRKRKNGETGSTIDEILVGIEQGC